MTREQFETMVYRDLAIFQCTTPEQTRNALIFMRDELDIPINEYSKYHLVDFSPSPCPNPGININDKDDEKSLICYGRQYYDTNHLFVPYDDFSDLFEGREAFDGEDNLEAEKDGEFFDLLSAR